MSGRAGQIGCLEPKSGHRRLSVTSGVVARPTGETDFAAAFKILARSVRRVVGDLHDAFAVVRDLLGPVKRLSLMIARRTFSPSSICGLVFLKFAAAHRSRCRFAPATAARPSFLPSHCMKVQSLKPTVPLPGDAGDLVARAPERAVHEPHRAGVGWPTATMVGSGPWKETNSPLVIKMPNRGLASTTTAV